MHSRCCSAFPGRQIDSAFDDDFKPPAAAASAQEVLTYAIHKLELEKKRATDFHAKCQNIMSVHRLRIHRARALLASSQQDAMHAFTIKGANNMDSNDLYLLMHIFQVHLNTETQIQRDTALKPCFGTWDAHQFMQWFQAGEDQYFEALRLVGAIARVAKGRGLLSAELNLQQAPWNWNYQEICAWLMARNMGAWVPEFTKFRIFSDMLAEMDARRAHRLMSKAGSERALKQIIADFRDMCKASIGTPASAPHS